MRVGAAALLLLASSVQAQTTYPEYDNLYVNDYADLLPEARLSEKLQDLKDARGIEFTVLTIDRLSDYGHTGSIEAFATGLFNSWGIGNADRDDGVLLLISRLDRELRIELGSGYGTSLNPEMKRIIDKYITPPFREGVYYTGIDAGVTNTIIAITGRYPGEYDANLPTRTFNKIIRGFWWIIGLGSPFIAFFGFKAYRHHKRTKPRICQIDGSKMYWMTDEDEDAFLQEGQIIEEDLKSIDHDVWACRQCDHIRIEAYPSWRSKYKQCPNCSYKTQRVTKVTNVPATYEDSGSGVAHYQCLHCEHDYQKVFTIPQKQQASSSSSSSSSSSFGGGSSSGGGASGSW